VFNLANGTEQPIARTANRKIAASGGSGDKTVAHTGSGGRATAYATDGGRMDAAQQIDNILSNKNNSINMKEKFPQVFALLGVESMECTEEGTFFNASLLETLNGKIEAMQQEVAQAQELAGQLTQEKAAMESQLTEKDAQMEQMKADHAAAVETLNAAHATAIEEKDNAIAVLEQEKADLVAGVNAKCETIETMQTELNGAKESLTTAQNTIAERDQQIADLNATIDEMKQEPGEGAQLNGPKSNGQGADAPKVVVGCYVYNNDLTYEQNMEAEERWNKEHGK